MDRVTVHEYNMSADLRGYVNMLFARLNIDEPRIHEMFATLARKIYAEAVRLADASAESVFHRPSFLSVEPLYKSLRIIALEQLQALAENSAEYTTRQCHQVMCDIIERSEIELSLNQEVVQEEMEFLCQEFQRSQDVS